MTIHASMLAFRVINLMKSLKLPFQQLLGQISLCITSVALTCPLDSEHNIQSARSRKQNKIEYLQLLAEFDSLQTLNTAEISVLGHYTSHPLFKTLRISLTSYNLLLHPNPACPNLLSDRSLTVQLEQV